MHEVISDQVFIRGHRFIIVDDHCLTVAALFTGHIGIGRILERSSRVARNYLDHARRFLYITLRAPETAAGKIGALVLLQFFLGAFHMCFLIFIKTGFFRNARNLEALFSLIPLGPKPVADHEEEDEHSQYAIHSFHRYISKWIGLSTLSSLTNGNSFSPPS